MASKRKQVLDAVVAACAGITGVKSATQEYETWWQMNAHDFPRIIVRDTETELEPWSFQSSAGNDMLADMEVVVSGFVHDMHNNLATKRTDLIQDIEQTLIADSSLDALIFSIWPVRIETDNQGIDNYSIFDVVFRIQYLYNHASP